MVAILSKKDLQIEGTGSEPTDVMFDGRYQILNAIRADRFGSYSMAATRAGTPALSRLKSMRR